MQRDVAILLRKVLDDVDKALADERKGKCCTGWCRTQAMTARDRLVRFALCRKRGLRLLEARTVGELRRKTRPLQIFFEHVRRGKLVFRSRGLRLLETGSVGELRRKARLWRILGNVGSGKVFARWSRFFRSNACPESLNKIGSGNPCGFSDLTELVTTYRMLDLRSPFFLPPVPCHL